MRNQCNISHNFIIIEILLYHIYVFLLLYNIFNNIISCVYQEIN
jgi:hypothetical protein